jgi:hypothetical protein
MGVPGAAGAGIGWPTNDYAPVPGSRGEPLANCGGSVLDSGQQVRYVCFDVVGAAVYMFYSAPDDPTDMTEVDISSYVRTDSLGSYMVGGPWLIITSGPDVDSCYFIAWAKSDDRLHLFSLSFTTGSLTEHCYVLPNTYPGPASIQCNGMTWWKNRIWIGFNYAGSVNYNASWGFWDSSEDVMVYPDWPTYPIATSGNNAEPKWYSNTNDTNMLWGDDSDLHITMGDDMSGSGRYDLTNPITVTGFENSPPACVYDFLTNTRYGMGIDTAKIDEESFSEAHDYCVEMLSSTDQRYSLDIILDSYKSGLDHLLNMLQSFAAFLVWSEGVIKLKIDKDESSVATLTTDDIVDGSLTWSYPGLSDLPNRIKAEFRNRDDDYRWSYVFANSEFDQEETEEIRELLIRFLGVTRETQARRLGQLYLDNAASNKIVATFGVGINHLKFEVGDIVSITHILPSWTAKKFRIMEISEGEQDVLNVIAREYTSEIHHDEQLAVQSNTASYPDSIWEAPRHVEHLDAFEDVVNKNSIMLMFSLPTDPGWFAGAAIYMSLDDETNYTYIGTTSNHGDSGLLNANIGASDASFILKEIREPFDGFTAGEGSVIIGDEIIHFTTYVDNLDNTITLGGCTRAYKNTVAVVHSEDDIVLIWTGDTHPSTGVGTFRYVFDPEQHLYHTLYFRAISINERGVEATPTAGAPTTSIIPVGVVDKLPPPDSVQINDQGGNTDLADSVDCNISWRAVNPHVGYGRMRYGIEEFGYGGGGRHSSFTSFTIRILDSSLNELRVIMDITGESYNYTAAMRATDGTDTGADFYIRVYQNSTGNISAAGEIQVNT